MATLAEGLAATFLRHKCKKTVVYIHLNGDIHRKQQKTHYIA